ncbi:MAG: hypothetical protein CL609_06030 [Anaerolineaceae bacterium]|nr:hypothetical protein [Anaerolineaceae bacterium]
MKTIYRILLSILFSVPLMFLAAEDPPPYQTASEDLKAELWSAFSDKVLQPENQKNLTFDLFTPELDEAFLTPDGTTAVLWLALRDEYGQRLATEPGLVIAVLNDNRWEVLLPDDPAWEKTITTLPAGLVPLEQSPSPEDIETSADIKAPVTGYYLPYAAGTSRWLEGSISHFQSIPELGYPSCKVPDDCRYAYDFTDAWHFPLLAAKEGRVVASRDSCTDGNPYCTNYIVLQEPDTQLYQIYIHLANNTIPDKLTNGTLVKRGQYLGDTDDTGYSTSQHVHFMVTNSIWLGGDGYYWGRSIDIRFVDVAINNGIPRTCYEVTHFPIYDGATECLGDKTDPRNPANDWFPSGNVGAYPPTGSLSVPAAGATVTVGSTQIMDVRANASDDVRVTAVSLVAKLDGQWNEIGPKISQTIPPGVYDWDVNLCEAGVAVNGALEVALRVWDHEGNVSTALTPRTIQVDHSCPPPSSQLNPVQDFDSTAALLSWQAVDAGAGLSTFEIQWRTNPGTWQTNNTLIIPGAQRSAWFSGQGGTSYAFRLRAVDENGQVEAWPTGDNAETSVTFPSICTTDSSEPDNTSGQAKLINLGNIAQRNLCPAGDNDWFQITVQEGKYYQFNALSLNGGAAVNLTILADDGTTILTSAQAPGLGLNLHHLYKAENNGVVFFKFTPLVTTLFGTQATYSVRVEEVIPIFLPMIVK